MADTPFLSLSNVVSVTVSLTASGLGLPNINTLGLASSEQPDGWDEDQVIKKYTDAAAVATDFGSDSKAYDLAKKAFAQVPNFLGTSGYFCIFPRLQTLAAKASKEIQNQTYRAVATGTGGNSITIAYTAGAVKGAEVVSVVSNAISVQIANGSSINAEVASKIRASVAASALVDVELEAGHELDTVTTVGATNLTGGAATGVLESVEDAIARVKNKLFFFGVIQDLDMDDDLDALGDLVTYMEGIDKLFFYTSSDEDQIAEDGSLDQGAAQHFRGLYYGDSEAGDQSFAAAYAGRALSVAFAGSKTVQTLHLKTLRTVDADSTMTEDILEAAKTFGVDTYPSIQGSASIFCTKGEHGFFDQVYNSLWLKSALEVSGFNFLKQAQTKIPQTEEGVNGLRGAYGNVLEQAKNNGYCAPGKWNGDVPFGDPEDFVRNIETVGYYQYNLPVKDQSQEDREDREAPLFQIALKEAGAIQSSLVVVNVQP